MIWGILITISVVCYDEMGNIKKQQQTNNKLNIISKQHTTINIINRYNETEGEMNNHVTFHLFYSVT